MWGKSQIPVENNLDVVPENGLNLWQLPGLEFLYHATGLSETLSECNWQQSSTFTVFQADLRKTKRGGDSVQLPPRVTRCIDTSSLVRGPGVWVGRGGVAVSSSLPRLPDTWTVLFFPSFCQFGKEKRWRSVSCPAADWTKGPPDRERRSRVTHGFPVSSSSRLILLSCLAKEKKKKLNHLRRLGLPPGSCWVGNHRLLSTWLHRCVARPLHVSLQATSDSFWWAKGRIAGSRRYSTSVSGHVHMPEKMCFNARYQPANRKLACLCIPLFGMECLQCLRYNDTMNRNSTMIQNETMQWYNEARWYNAMIQWDGTIQ